MNSDFLDPYKEAVENIVQLAKEVEIGDPFDWADVAIDEDEAYRMMAMNILSMEWSKEIATATIVKLCVENMVLNVRLMQNK